MAMICCVSKQEEKRDNQIEKFRKVDARPAVRRQQRPKGTANHRPIAIGWTFHRRVWWRREY